MKILVCGGRSYSNKKEFNEYMDRINEIYGPIVKIIHGGANGADSMAQKWAENHKISTTIYQAKWHKYGKAAGPIRNKEMLEKEKPNLIIAFPGGHGTRNMVELACEAEVLTIEFTKSGITIVHY